MTFTRSVKGAPASVLLALLMTHRPMTNQELQRWTGYAHDAITLAIGTLLDLGWLSATSDRGPWSIVPGRQVPLGAQPQLDDGRDDNCDLTAPPSSSSIIMNNDDSVPNRQEQETQDACGLTASLLSSSSKIFKNQDSIIKEQETKKGCDLTAVPEPAPKDAQATSATDDDHEDPRFVANLHALYDAGIREPTAGRLAHLPHVNPEYIAAHVDVANTQGFKLGTAIHRIQHAWPIPHTKPVISVDDKINKFRSEQWRSQGPPVWDDESPDRPADPPFDPEDYHDRTQ